jgi:hypothetical protein
MRNAKLSAKQSRLYDHALTSTLTARNCWAGSVEGSREMRRSQLASIASRNIQGTPRRGWHVKTLAGQATRPVHVALVAATQARVPALNNWMLRDIGITCAGRDLSQQQAVLEGVTQMQTTSMHTPARRGGALVRTVRAVGRWFSRSVNTLGQPYANADADRWFDWPRLPPF